jgi:hypothetical protein
MFGSAIIPAVIIWRLLTYYLVIAAGGVMVVIDNIMNVSVGKKDISKGLVPEIPKNRKPAGQVI